MRFLTIAEVLHLHFMVVERSGGGFGVRDLAALLSCVSQPQATFGGTELYASTAEQAAALCFFLVRNHPFLDGNKRTGHAAMETFLVLNGYEISAPIDEQEQVMLSVASGAMSRESFAAWVAAHVRPRSKPGPA